MILAKLGSALLAATGFLLAALSGGPVQETAWLWSLLTVAFLLAGPTVGWVSLFQVQNRLVSAALTVVSSLSAVLLVATALAVSGNWDVNLGLTVLATIGLLGAVVWLIADQSQKEAA